VLSVLDTLLIEQNRASVVTGTRYWCTVSVSNDEET